MKYLKKPVVVEAMQFTTNNETDNPVMNKIVAWVNAGGGNASHNGTDIVIWTLEGPVRASVGDWIVRGVKGEFYPCKPDIFAASYEPVDPPESKHPEGHGTTVAMSSL